MAASPGSMTPLAGSHNLTPFIKMDAAFRRLQEYDPDLDLAGLCTDLDNCPIEERSSLLMRSRIVRMTLVASIADIVKQNAHEPAALDIASAMAEVLISTCGDADEYPVQGHKNAMQAIQLLASVYSRLDQTIDLFFDLVERFCAQSCSRDPTRHSACVTRTIQDYDEMLLKLISKHWHASGPEGSWDVIRPMQRIKDLRHIYVPSEGSKRQLILGRARRKAAMSHLFSESYQALRTVEKQRRRGPPRSPMTSGFRDSHSALSQWSGSTTSPVASAAHPSPPQRYALPEEEEALSTPVPSQDDTPDMYELDAGWLAESSVPTQEEDDALAEYEAREADWPLAKTTAYVSAAELPPFAHKYEHAYHRRHGTFDSIPTFRIAAAA